MRSLKHQFGACTRGQWILTSGLLAIIIGFWIFFYRPATARLSQMHVEIAEGKQRLQTNQTATNTLVVVRQEVARMQARVERFDKRLPHREEIGPFISDITRSSRDLQLKKLVVQQGGLARVDRFYEKPIWIRFEGDFLAAAGFLRQVEDLPRLTRLRKLSVKSRDSKLGVVEVELTMNIYFSEG